MERTNLNVSPYYDDFSEDKNFHRVLFRPGFAVQARELTQLQSILQNQIERHGRHIFKEGTVVIPGALGFTNEYYAVKLQSTYASADISVHLASYVGKTIIGSTTGIKAEVIQVEAATTTDPITLYVKYFQTGTDNETFSFQDNETIFSPEAVTDNSGTVIYTANTVSAQLLATNATSVGSSASIDEGVYFIRGNFVKVNTQRIILDKYTNTPSYRVGFTIVETLETPEEDLSLLDNAQGSTNLNAKGAHRLKFTLTLSKLDLNSENDKDFVELMRLDNGVVQSKVRTTEYSVLGDTLARRTYDESGDYYVKKFDILTKETLNDGLNDGVYDFDEITDSGNTASEDYFTIQISPGKAYVKGYEIETLSPKYIDVLKPRTYNTLSGAATPIEVGNYVFVNNVYGTPEISPKISGEIPEPYKEISLYNEATGTPGSPSSGTKIGVARVRAFEHYEGNATSGSQFVANSSTSDSLFKLYVFDLRMFTQLTLSGNHVGGIAEGDKVIGQITGAFGFIKEVTSNTITLTGVVGSFEDGETMTCTGMVSLQVDEVIRDISNNALTISSISSYDFSSVKQVYMDDTAGGGTDPDFTADIYLDSNLTLTGLVSITSLTTSLNGSQTNFTQDLVVGDVLAIPSGTNGTLQEIVVTNIISDTVATISGTVSNTVTTVQATRKRAQLNDQNKNILLRKLQKNRIKSLKTENNSGVSDSIVTLRRQFTGTTNTSGSVTFTLGTGESFNSVTNTDYVLSIQSAGSGSGVKGDLINMNSSTMTVQNNVTSLVITDSTLLGSAAQIHLIATVTKSNANEKTKTSNKCYMVLVDNDGISPAPNSKYGTSAHHKEISLGKADVYKLRAIFESAAWNVDPVPPSWTYNSASGVFTKGELVTGQTSGAKATVIRTDSSSLVFSYISLNNLSFISGETVVGAESGQTMVLDTFTESSRDVTNKYVFDTGQRDNFYDISRLIRKSTSTTPIGRLLVICDYFSHGNGDFFTVDSYSGQIDYKEIPYYTASRVDPEVREPTGNYDLRDSIDFRPKVADITTGASTTIYGELAYRVDNYSFNFAARNYVDTGSSVSNIPKDNSNFLYDLEYYLGRFDSLYLKKDGNFLVVNGAPDENPTFPSVLDDAMKIANLFIDPYVISVNNINFNLIDNKRYTMRDIGNLEKRLSNVEYYTSLSLLEQNANSFQILDVNGLDRFKSGFIVDNFKGHSIGDPLHPDYRNSIDMTNNELRPKHYMKNVFLTEEYTTDAERSTRSYQKTGDILTLPYQQVISIKQPYATRIENLNPSLFFTWAGECKLSPSEDEWFETNRLPDLIINREGNFDTVLAQNRNSLGTIWNAWQTQWSGQLIDTTSRTVENRVIDRSGGRPTWTGDEVVRSATARTGTRLITSVTTNIVEQIDVQRDERVLSVAVIPFIRSRNVSFVAKGLKPFTKVYPFFDKTNVTQYITPTGGSLGGNLITDATGSVSGIFSIPNPNTRGNPKFRTGERIFRLTSNSTNSLINLETEAQATYTASGTLTTRQLSIISTRNARVVRTSSSTRQQLQEIVSVGNVISRQQVSGWFDPLAQSFRVGSIGGEFLTKIDVYFNSKDNNIPVRLEIREMENGYPTGKILPFSTVILDSSDVSISSDASLATTFTFESPVYVDSEKEYCVTLISDSKNYTAWISRMGEQDISGNRLVSEQPYLGVLFKSQNNSTWTAYDFEDLKFTLYRADFDTTSTGLISYVNDELQSKQLDSDPIVTYDGQSYVKINHENHQMHNVINNVIIDGVSSEISTELTSTILSSDGNGATFTIDSATNFPSSGTVYVKIGTDIISGTLASTTFTISTRTGSTEHASGSTVELYMLNGIPLTEINKTHTSLMSGKIGMDYYFLSTTTAANVTDVGGGNSVTASENILFNTIQTLIPYLNYSDTNIIGKIQTTTSTSPSGIETSFNFESSSVANIIPLNDNYNFSYPRMVCSQINENNELSGNKSFRLTFEINSTRSNLSPVIDTNRKSFIAIANRLNNITSSTDVFPTSDYVFPTEPSGDNNDAIYITKQIQLKTPGNAIKVYFDASRPESSNIDLMFRILRSDDSSDFDELGWDYFNVDGSPDTTVNAASTLSDFTEYEYTINDLPEFISFAIKIRMRGTNSSEVPRIKNLRAIALAT